MPGIFHEPLSRRDALRVLGASAAGSWLHLAVGGRLSAGEETAQSWHVALLADTHIPADANNGYRGFKPVENLKQVVPQILAAQPEAVMLAGDAARLAGLPGDYQALRRLLEPVAQRTPILIGLGNHDDRRNFYAEFPSERLVGRQPVSGKHVTMLEHPALRIVMLDSLLYVNKVAGLLGKAQRTWLEQTLPMLADRPLVLFVHHTLGDGDGDLLDVDRLFALIEPHRHVKAIFYGHSHQYNVKQRDGVQLVNLPACGYNFTDRDPVGWVDAQFDAKGVRLTLRAIGGNRTGDGQTTTVAWLR